MAKYHGSPFHSFENASVDILTLSESLAPLLSWYYAELPPVFFLSC